MQNTQRPTPKDQKLSPFNSQFSILKFHQRLTPKDQRLPICLQLPWPWMETARSSYLPPPISLLQSPISPTRQNAKTPKCKILKDQPPKTKDFPLSILNSQISIFTKDQPPKTKDTPFASRYPGPKGNPPAFHVFDTPGSQTFNFQFSNFKFPQRPTPKDQRLPSNCQIARQSLPLRTKI